VELPVQGFQLRGFVSSHLRINMQDGAVPGVEAEVSMLHRIQTAGQQAGRAQQRERQSGLRDYQ